MIQLYILITLSMFLQDMERVDLHMSELMEDVYVCLENPENSSVKEFEQARQACLDYYIETVVDVLPLNRVYYWEGELESTGERYLKLKKEFKDD